MRENRFFGGPRPIGGLDILYFPLSIFPFISFPFRISQICHFPNRLATGKRINPPKHLCSRRSVAYTCLGSIFHVRYYVLPARDVWIAWNLLSSKPPRMSSCHDGIDLAYNFDSAFLVVSVVQARLGLQTPALARL